jgi:hypothetical protein
VTSATNEPPLRDDQPPGSRRIEDERRRREGHYLSGVAAVLGALAAGLGVAIATPVVT